MFDLAWSEIMLIGAVALVVIGPKELPGAIRTISQFIRKAREMAWEMRGHVDEMVREANLDEVRNQINEIRNFDIKGEVTKAVDPDGSLRRTVSEAGESLQEATRAMDDPDRHPPPADESASSAEEPAEVGEASAMADPDSAAAEDRTVERQPLGPAAVAGVDIAERAPDTASPEAPAAAPDSPDKPAAGTAPAPAPVAPVTTPRPPAPAYEAPVFVPPGTSRN